MKKLLSLPPNLVECFHDIEKVDRSEWFCTSDPVGSKLGSGGGTAWLLEACQKEWDPELDFMEWLGSIIGKVLGVVFFIYIVIHGIKK